MRFGGTRHRAPSALTWTGWLLVLTTMPAVVVHARLAARPRTCGRTQVDMVKAGQFQPREIRVVAGQSVTWTNKDQAPHTVTTDADCRVRGGPNSDRRFPNGVPAGMSYHWVVPKAARAGTTWYCHCRFHGKPGDGTDMGGGMVGEITVR